MMDAGMGRALTALLVALMVGGVSQASTTATPQDIYRALLTRRFTGLPSGHYSAKVGADSLSDKDKRHHAVGAVLITIDTEAAVDYVVYPTQGDVADRWKEPPSKPDGVREFHVLGAVPGYGATRSRWVNATIEGNNAFGKKVRNGMTIMYVQRRNVIVAAITISTDNDASGDVPATLKLMKAAIAHLDRIAGWSKRAPGGATPRTTAPPKPKDARASAYVGGNSSPRLPAGGRGLVVVARGPYQQELSLPVVVRNNTSRTVIRVSVSATAAGPGGQLLATGKDQTLHPNVVRPGEIAFGYVYFKGVHLPANARFAFKVSTTAPADEHFENIRDLAVAESHRIQDRITGTLRNGYSVRVTGPISVMVACFSASGKLLYTAQDFTDQDQVAGRGTLPFQVDAAPPYGSSGLSCPKYLVAASGYTA